PVLGVAQVAVAPHRGRLLGDPGGGPEGQALRHEEVPGVAVRHVDDVALLADLVEVGPQHDLHDVSSSVVAVPASTSAPSGAAPRAASVPSGASVSASVATSVSGAGRSRSRSRPRRSPSRLGPRVWVTRLL